MKNPTHSRSLISMLFYCWAFPIIRKGNIVELEIEDIPPTPPHVTSNVVICPLEKEWNLNLSQFKIGKVKKVSLRKTLLKVYGPQVFLLNLLGFFIECILSNVAAILLGYNLSYLQGDYSNNTGLFFITFLIAVLGLKTILNQPFVFLCSEYAMKMRVACSALIYKKLLKLDPNSIHDSSVGKISNIMSNDLYIFDFGLRYVNYLWICPVSLVVGFFVLYTYVGISALGGVGILALLSAPQFMLGKLNSIVREKLAACTDVRVKLINELINSIFLIKLSCWEYLFTEKISESRKKEEVMIKLRSLVLPCSLAMSNISSQITIFITLIIFLNLGNSLTSTNTFVAATILTDLGSLCVGKFVRAVISYSDLIVAIQRIERFLLLEEKDDSLSLLNEINYSKKPKYLKISKYFGKVGGGEKNFKLSDINLRVDQGKFVCIIGQVGSGKSTLLKSVLGETGKISGDIEVYGKIAYHSQDAWIFPGTVRENVLFGKPMDKIFYEEVIRACALSHDLSTLRYGDLSLIGDRGLTLSGGQKARISLARAIYQNADIYLLDDPLSAVDSKVCKHLLENCVQGILRNKAVLLITHQIQCLSEADEIIVFENGAIKDKGNFNELASKKLINLPSIDNEDDIDEIMKSVTCPKDDIDDMNRNITSSFKSKLKNDYGTFSKYVECEQGTKEEKSNGLVGVRVIWNYLLAGNKKLYLVLIIFLSVFVQALASSSSYLLKIWTSSKGIEDENSFMLNNSFKYGDQVTEESVFSFNNNTPHIEFWFIVLNILFIVFSLLNSISIFRTNVNSAITFHKLIFKTVIRAPMKFFELNSSGRIINRFVKDVGILDQYFGLAIHNAMNYLLKVLGIFAILSTLYAAFILPSLFVLILFYFIRNYYLTAASNIQRIELICRSPIVSQLGTSIDGLTTIRALKAEKYCTDEFFKKLDEHSAAYYMCIGTTRWLGVCLDWTGYIYSALVIIVFSLFIDDPPTAGLAISSVLGISSYLTLLISISAEMENQAVSVERVAEYMNIPSEAPFKVENNRTPPNYWPQKGHIQFDDIEVRYDLNKHAVLSNINFSIKPNEKIGIVGRTGAGKSTLVSALFRIIEPTRGRVHIDGLDTSIMGLHDLRNKISFIPQNPVLFMGNLRKNLDPFGKYSDTEIWNAIREVHLHERILQNSSKIESGAASGLQSEILEGGSNFSHGEKQLICLARAMLNRNKILILDEATAHIDQETDKLIQMTIREKFQDCTVITIAHRLGTIIDSDRIILIDNGKIAEFDEPYKLLQNTNSHFHQLVIGSGKASADSIIKILNLSNKN